MKHYTYLIIGGGMTADAAVRGIRERDPQGSIGLISEEPDPPYNRPPLSKGLWQGKPLEKIWRRTERHNVAIHLAQKAQALDPQNKRVIDDQGAVYAFDKLLLATGGTPRRLAFDEGHIIYFRTLGDYHRLRALTQQGQRFGVIGGGFIGSEIAAALAMNGKEVVMIFPEDDICGRVFPRDLAHFVTRYYQEKGVQVEARETITGIEVYGERLILKIQGGQEFQAEGVVAGLGIEPNVELARSAGLEVDNGIVVDECLRTRHSDIFAAGDVANFYNPTLGKRMRVEHEDNANTMGRLVGRNMAGATEPYRHLPFFYSDLFELGYVAVGELDGRLDTVADWQEPYRKGVVYYLEAGRVRGVLLWNVRGQLNGARGLIAEPGPFQPADLKGRVLA